MTVYAGSWVSMGQPCSPGACERVTGVCTARVDDGQGSE